MLNTSNSPLLKIGLQLSQRPFSWLRIWVGLFLVCLPCIEPQFRLSAQTVEDFACAVPVSVSNSRPAVVTCPAGHGFNQRSFVWLSFAANPVSGDTLKVDGVSYTFVSKLDNTAANQVLIGFARSDTAWYLNHAINDDGNGKGVTYSQATTAHPTFTAGTSIRVAGLTLFSRAMGAAALGKSIVSSATSRFAPDTQTTRMEWNVFISGGTGKWSGIGTNQTPKYFYARYEDPTHFSLYTAPSVPYDSTGSGAFDSQSLLIWRASAVSGIYYPAVTAAESWSVTGTVDQSGVLKVRLPGCTDLTHELECAMSRRVPEIAHNSLGSYQNIKSFTISGGVGNITFTANYPYIAGDGRNLFPGSLVWLRNLSDTASTWSHPVSLDNDIGGTVTNHLVKYVPATSRVTQLLNLDAGGAIGVCQSGCGNSGTATILDAGLMTCSFDNATVAGHWVTVTGYDDRCHDAGANFPSVRQPVGVVQDSGPAGDHRIWWNGLNRAYVVQSADRSNGQGVTRITINVPGYPDGDYTSSATLPGIKTFFPNAAMWNALVDINYVISPYVIFPAGINAGYVYPLLPRLMKDPSGFDPATTNRISFWTKWDKSQLPCQVADAAEWGTYFMPPGFSPSQGQHYYHNLDPTLYTGQWALYTFNLVPSHQVGQSENGQFNYPNEPTMTGSPYGWYGSGHYFDRMDTFYLDLSGIFCPASRDTSGQELLISPITLDSVTGEPEELVKARGGIWSQKRFQKGDANPSPSGSPGYDLYWSGPRGMVVQYEVRQSTKASLKTLGFSNGTCRSGTTSCGASDRVSTDGTGAEWVKYQSVMLQHAQDIWWGIKPVSIPIVSTSGAGQNPTWIISSVDVGMSVGDHVTVSGVSGNSAANQTDTAIAAVQPRQIWPRFDPIPQTISADAYLPNSGGPVIIRSANHGLLAGQTVQIRSATPASLNGQFTVTVIDGDTLSVDGTSYDSMCPCTGGILRLNAPSSLVNIVADGSGQCVANLASPHNLTMGWKFYLWGATDAKLSPADGVSPSTYTVTSTPSATSFGFACPNVPGKVFDTDQPLGRLTIQSFPAIALPVAGTGSYSRGGSIATTEDFKNFAEIHLWRYSNAAHGTVNRQGGQNVPGGAAPAPAPMAKQAQACAFELSAAQTTAGARRNAASVNVITGAGCAWNASSQASWIRLNNASGTGSGEIPFQVADNSGRMRTGQIVISGQTFTVRQSGRPSEPAKTGLFRNGAWVLDRQSDGWSYRVPAQVQAQRDTRVAKAESAPAIPVVGDWTGDGFSKTGLFRPGTWQLDTNGDGSSFSTLTYQGDSSDFPVVGDWSGDGRAKAGVFRNGAWLLDVNGDGSFSRTLTYQGQSGDFPVVGDWSGDGRAKAGVFRNGVWLLDVNGDGSFSRTLTYQGQSGDFPVVGDWSGDGRAKVGVFRNGAWLLDQFGDGTFSRVVAYSATGSDFPVVGDWNGDGRAKIGIFRPGVWVLDYDGTYVLDTSQPGSTRVLTFQPAPADIPLIGRWYPGIP